MSPVFHRESSYTFKIFSNEELRMHIHVFRDDFEAVCILICFPLIVAIGAGSSVTGSKSSAINKFLGEISYPIYITHYPLIYMQMSWADSHKDAPLGTHIFVSICIFVLAILVAYVAYKLYDLPVREWLKHKLFKSAIKREESDARINSSEREQARPKVKPVA